MPIDNLKFSVESLKNEYAKISTKRQQWNETTVPLLKTVLQKVIEQYELAWKIEESTQRKNAGKLSLSFGQMNSGIADAASSGLEHLTKFGGSLSFEQSYFGDIDVNINYPYLEEGAEYIKKQKRVMSIAPADVDDEFIYLQIGRFLTEVIAWESGSGADKMG